LEPEFRISVYKQYFNFSSAHFLVFKNGDRERLHGHNYRVKVKGSAPKLEGDMVFDFLHLKPIVREICDDLDHKLLIAGDNPHINIETTSSQIRLVLTSGDSFSFPTSDVLVLPISNTSVERLAVFLSHQINHKVQKKYQFEFQSLEVEVEETPGQSASYKLVERGPALEV